MSKDMNFHEREPDPVDVEVGGVDEVLPVAVEIPDHERGSPLVPPRLAAVTLDREAASGALRRPRVRS
jgi:hypothetical protein